MCQFWLDVLANFLGGGIVAGVIIIFFAKWLTRHTWHYREKTQLRITGVVLYTQVEQLLDEFNEFKEKSARREVDTLTQWKPESNIDQAYIDNTMPDKYGVLGGKKGGLMDLRDQLIDLRMDLMEVAGIIKRQQDYWRQNGVDSAPKLVEQREDLGRLGNLLENLLGKISKVISGVRRL